MGLLKKIEKNFIFSLDFSLKMSILRRNTPSSSRGLGHSLLKAVTGVRFP